MISFCMPKPVEHFMTIIEETVEKTLVGKDLRPQESHVQKAIKQLAKQVKVSFQDIEFNLEKIRSITKVITETTIDMLPDRKDIYKSISGMINKGELKKIIQQVI